MLSGSLGLGYISNWGRNTSKMLTNSYIGDHVWFNTSKQIEPETKSTFGWYILLIKPTDGDL